MNLIFMLHSFKANTINLFIANALKVVENLLYIYHPQDNVQEYWELIPLLFGSLKMSFKEFFNTQYPQS